MRLYTGTSTQFITDILHNRITDLLSDAFFRYYHYKTPESEVRSWRNSLRAFKDVLELGDLKDQGIVLEYRIPQTSRRLDCLLTGRDRQNRNNAVIVELKQWESTLPSDGPNEVCTFIGGYHRDQLHPSVQVGQYRRYLRNAHTAFHSGNAPVALQACAYLHNFVFDPAEPIYDEKFSEALTENPIFAGDQVQDLAGFLSSQLEGGEGMEVLRQIDSGEYRPSQKLMDNVVGMIRGDMRYILLDEQLIAYDKVLTTIRSSIGVAERRKDPAQRTVVIIKGGPGTGKSVVALNLIADLLKEKYHVQHATSSRAFTLTLRKILGRDNEYFLKYFQDYRKAKPQEFDAIICDEAHRLPEKTVNRFRPSESSDVPQAQEIMFASTVSVFFIDDFQAVRPGEVGSVAYLREMAASFGFAVEEFQLETQFRCAGADSFVNWINSTLDIIPTSTVLWTGEEPFDFKIVASAQDLEAAIRQKVAEGHSARMTAGFCWSWSKELGEDGGLQDDLVIGDYRRPWNANPQIRRLPKTIPSSEYWATDPAGIEQVGCVYTAQGFEFDYVGVIFGNDLVYDPDAATWVGRKENSQDHVVKRSKEQFPDLVKNTYRVLLSRGMKGCYVCFVDKDTERFFKSRIVRPR